MKERAEMSDNIALSEPSAIELEQEMVGPELAMLEGAVGRRPRRADAEANRQQILEAAQRLFDKHGIGQVTMSSIAVEAGVGKGTLYRAVANKGELCLALMDADLRRFQNQVLSELRASWDRPALLQLDHFLDALIHFLDRHSELMAAAEAFGLLQGRSEIHQTALHRWFHMTVHAMLLQARREGQIEPHAAIDYLADLILAPLNPRLFEHQRRVQGYSLQMISGNLRAFVRRGLHRENSQVSA
jgi:AcrR family transcriptional regulator